MFELQAEFPKDYLVLQMEYKGSYFEGAMVQQHCHGMGVPTGHLAEQLAKSSYQGTAIDTADMLDIGS